MSDSNQQVDKKINMFHGVVGLILAISVTVSGFFLGVSFIPMGGVAVTACIFGLIQMIQTKKPAAFFILTFVMAIGILLKDYLP